MIQIDVRTEWNGPQAKARAKKALFWWLKAGGVIVARRVRERLSTEGTGRIRGRRAGPRVHSSPGESPFKQTGMLRASIREEVDRDQMESRVGTPSVYGAILELLRNRPFLRVSMAESKPQIEAMAQRIPNIIAGE